MRGGHDEPLAHEVTLGDDEDLRSALLDVRKFLAEKEDVFFPRVANAVERLVTNAELREANAANRATWRRLLEGGGMLTIVIDNRAYTPERLFDLVINGGLFHDDKAKSEEFATFTPLMRDLALHNVNRLVIELARVLHAERNLVGAAFERGAIRAPDS